MLKHFHYSQETDQAKNTSESSLILDRRRVQGSISSKNNKTSENP
jgi:hypothetical protein